MSKIDNGDRGYPYALTLESEYEDEGEYYGFSSEELANWIEESVTFCEGEYSLQVKIPGVTESAFLSIGSPFNDKLLALSTCYGTPPLFGEPHPDLHRFPDRENIPLQDDATLFEGLIY